MRNSGNFYYCLINQLNSVGQILTTFALNYEIRFEIFASIVKPTDHLEVFLLPSGCVLCRGSRGLLAQVKYCSVWNIVLWHK